MSHERGHSHYMMDLPNDIRFGMLDRAVKAGVLKKKTVDDWKRLHREGEGNMKLSFAIIGVGGYIASRHLQAVYDTGNQVIAAIDPNDSVGLLDRYDFGIQFFTEIERFDRHLSMLQRKGDAVNYVSVCSPNYLHDSHCRLGMRAGADIICEKPLVLSPWNCDALQDMERDTGKRVNVVLQSRLHPKLIELKKKIDKSSRSNFRVRLTYVAGRGNWYHHSWKGDVDKSGGIAMNIGIHFFDVLLWLFGPVESFQVHISDKQRVGGYLRLKKAEVQWFLSVDIHDLPFFNQLTHTTWLRSLSIDGKEVEYSDGFTQLHTEVYRKILAGEGFGIDEARPSIELVHSISQAKVRFRSKYAHPFVEEK